jgi:uncharacterized Zn ribbon protein
MPNESVSFRVHPFNPDDTILSIGIVQLNRETFAAQFSVAISGHTNFNPPEQWIVGSPVYIEVGYDDNLQTLFAGRITEMELNSSDSLGFYYTYKCQSDQNDKRLMKSANSTFKPELGVNVLGLSLTNKNDKVIGSIKVAGTAEVWCDYEIDFSGVGRIFSQRNASRVRHIVTDAIWTTEVFLDDEIPAGDDDTIVIQTPKGNCIILDDDSHSIVLKDSSGNMLKMGPGGIEITSENTVKTQADYIKQVTKGKQVIKAEGELRLEGVIVNIN